MYVSIIVVNVVVELIYSCSFVAIVVFACLL